MKYEFSGKLKYLEKEYIFTFDGEALHLQYLVNSNKTPANEIFGIDEYNGYNYLNEKRVDEEYIEGECFEKNKKIIFIPKAKSFLVVHNHAVSFDIEAYIIYKYQSKPIGRIAITSRELNYIYPTNEAFDYNFDNWTYSGTVKITTKPFINLGSEPVYFVCKGKKVKTYFNISSKTGLQNGDEPLSLSSNMYLEFEPTEDMNFILDLYFVVKQFIQFLCNRKNIVLESKILFSCHESGMYEECAELNVCGENTQIEEYPIQKNRFIPYRYIKGIEGMILQDIVDENLFMRQIPESYVAGTVIDEGKFVIITSAFEWEFRRTFPEGLQKSEGRIAAENEVVMKLKELADDSTGRQKEILKRLIHMFPLSSLGEQIVQTYKKYSLILNEFGAELYRINGTEYNCNKIGERLARQRNN